jgi:hypothetical protein
MPDQRKENRNTCYLRAEIYVMPNAEPIIAEAHDISDHGMRLVVLDARRLPDRFMISIPRRRMEEVVEVRRRADKELGVTIIAKGEEAMLQRAPR